MKKTKRSPGRPQTSVQIRGAMLKDEIKAKYGTISKAAEVFNIERAWLTHCLNHCKMDRQRLDEICQDLGYAPSFFVAGSPSGFIQNDHGLPIIPPYWTEDLFHGEINYLMTVRKLLALFGRTQDEIKEAAKTSRTDYDYLDLLDYLGSIIRLYYEYKRYTAAEDRNRKDPDDHEIDELSKDAELMRFIFTGNAFLQRYEELVAKEEKGQS